MKMGQNELPSRFGFLCAGELVTLGSAVKTNVLGQGGLYNANGTSEGLHDNE
jgi:hypothetical protein